MHAQGLLEALITSCACSRALLWSHQSSSLHRPCAAMQTPIFKNVLCMIVACSHALVSAQQRWCANCRSAVHWLKTSMQALNVPVLLASACHLHTMQDRCRSYIKCSSCKLCTQVWFGPSQQCTAQMLDEFKSKTHVHRNRHRCCYLLRAYTPSTPCNFQQANSSIHTCTHVAVQTQQQAFKYIAVICSPGQ